MTKRALLFLAIVGILVIAAAVIVLRSGEVNRKTVPVSQEVQVDQQENQVNETEEGQDVVETAWKDEDYTIAGVALYMTGEEVTRILGTSD